MSTHSTISSSRTVEGPSGTQRSTTYETKSASSYVVDSGTTATYRPTITPRNVIIQRSSVGGLGSALGGSLVGSRSYTIERSAHYGGLSIPSGSYAAVTNSGVSNVKQSREKEKRDMQDLNERFASYIEKVRFLEAQNRRLADELEKLKSKWGKETTQIKSMYQAELDEARKLLDDADKEKARLEIRVASMEEQFEETRIKLNEANQAVLYEREKVDRQNQQLSDYEAEINLLRRRLEQLEGDRDKDKKHIAQLQDALNRTRVDLDNETLLHIDAENRRQTLEEELEFLKAVHEQELKELAALAYRDTTAENREFWKNEMGQALREIHQVYDEKLDSMRGELETFYNLKIQEFRTGATRQNMEAVHSKEESKRLRTQVTELRAKLNDGDARVATLIRELENLKRDKEERERELETENNDFKLELAKLRAEMEAIMRELQTIVDSKLGLELEIAAYRKLLEGEENRDGLRQIVDSIVSNQEARVQSSYSSSSYSASSSAAAGGVAGGVGGYGYGSGSYGGSADGSLRVSQVTKGEMSAKTTYQRSAKGPVSISECSADGKYITLENTGRKEENLDGWKLKRNIDGIEKTPFSLDYVTIGVGSKIRVWAQGFKPATAPATDLEYYENNWGTGATVVSKLVNQLGEERATHLQKTVYA